MNNTKHFLFVLIVVGTLGFVFKPASNASFEGESICYIDRLNRFSLRLPEGWRADLSPDPNAVGGASVFYNYAQDEVKLDHGVVITIPPDHLKIEISTAQRPANQSLEQWLVNQIAPNNLDNLSPQALPELHPYKLGQYEGVVVTAISYGVRILEIVLAASEDRVAVITLTPADSPAVSEALAILSTLDASSAESCISRTTSIDDQVITFTKTLAENPSPISPYEYTCPQGTFPGDEAYDSSLPLQMPFRRGETWVVGGAGSFYGNYHHCNYYNNYYATDWNRAEGGDAGFPVLAIADGTVSAILAESCNADPNNRYGCYVQVDHVSNYRTIYAHLQDVTVQVGDSIRVGRWLGHVGCTGHCVDAHLHLSFWRADVAYGRFDYYSHCFNSGQPCPNGEAALQPQGHRPSPMMTTLGNTIIIDGGAFTSVNGWQIWLPTVLKK